MADTENIKIARKIIDSTLKMEESLAELLSVQVLHIKKLAGGDLGDEIVRTNILMRNIIMTLMLMDENMNRAIRLLEADTSPD